jgi:hypothetical protein
MPGDDVPRAPVPDNRGQQADLLEVIAQPPADLRKWTSMYGALWISSREFDHFYFWNDVDFSSFAWEPFSWRFHWIPCHSLLSPPPDIGEIIRNLSNHLDICHAATKATGGQVNPVD